MTKEENNSYSRTFVQGNHIIRGYRFSMMDMKDTRMGEFDTNLWFYHIGAFRSDRIEILPYLRPMSSMTEKEEDEYMIARQKDIAEAYIHSTPQNAIDYLLVHHFDYRGLIEKGLAIEATDGMYKIE